MNLHQPGSLIDDREWGLLNFFEHVTQVTNRPWLYEVAEVLRLIYYLPVLAVQRGNHMVLWGMRNGGGGKG